MRLEIKSLQRRLNVTTIYVTHDQVEAMTMADKIVILSGGEVEQVGSPQDIYHRPVNLFVATFIGSSAMNILTAKGDNNKLYFDTDNVIPMPKISSKIASNASLRVGIRPECIQLSVNKPNDAVAIKIRIGIVEDLGSQRVVHAHLGKQPMLIVTDLYNLNENGEIYIVLPTEEIYLFDATSGLNISHQNISG